MSKLSKAIADLSPEQRALLERRLKQKRSQTTRKEQISQRPDLSTYPFSSAQERLWLLDQLDPGATTYNITEAVRLKGLLDVSVLEQSLTEIVSRHDVLRATFSKVNGKPEQITMSPAALTLLTTDLRAVPESEQENRIQKIIEHEIQQPFDLSRGPLIRAQLLCLNPGDHLFLLSLHHIISDAWSFDVFMRELSTLYLTFAGGQLSSLPDLPIQYADFAHWQRQWLASEAAQVEAEYWQQQLDDQVQALQLPVDHKRQAGQSYEGSQQFFTLGPNLTEQLKSLSRQQQSTLFVTLLAAFNTLFHSYTGQEDMLVCSPVIGRKRVELECLIGSFNNIIVLRNDLGGNPTFLELISRTHEVVMGAYEHQEWPFKHVAELPNLKLTPLSRALFTVQDALTQSLTLPNISVKPLDVKHQTADFDLSLFMEERGETLAGEILYKTALFETDFMATLIEYFKELLENVVTNPEQPLSSIPTLMTIRKHLATHASSQKPDPTPDQSASESTFIPPRDELETQLVKIWEAVLGIRPLGIAHNFFELGGHSLLAVRLFTEIEQIFDKTLPLTTLFQAPTIKQLANILRQEDWSPSWSSLVMVQAGGPKQPFFFVHGAGGNVLIYRTLAKHLGTERPFYGLQSQGLDDVTPFYTCIKDMATHYLAELQALQPEGPYFIGGYCLGGTIAYEMAHQLNAQGHKVAALVLLDTYGLPVGKPLPSFIERGYEYFQQIIFHGGNFFMLDMQGKRTFLSEKLAVAKRRFKAKTPLKGATTALIVLRKANDQAAENYAPQVYPQNVTLFRPLKMYGLVNDPLLGWEGLITGHLDVQELQAYPGGMLVEPFVTELGQKLKATLDEADSISRHK